MVQTPVYLDHHSTTPVDPRVLEAMLPYFSERFGNAGSTSHVFGWQAKDAADAARGQIAAAVGALPKEIVLTSGATESNNLALKGAAGLKRRRGDHLVSVTTEHKSVLDPLDRLGRRGFEVTLLNVDRAGLVDLDQLRDSLRDDTLLVSLMLANNEIGTIAPVAEAAEICRERGVLLHCDATQMVGKLPVDVRALGVDVMSFTAHKIYGPKGVGALFIRRRGGTVRLEPQIDGGGQEHGLRSGTLPVPLMVGFAKAVELGLAEMETAPAELAALRDRLYRGLCERISGVTLNGPSLEDRDRRLPGNLNVSFDRVDGEALMMSMREIAVSSGSACTSANPEPSHVLRALGIGDDLTRDSLRFGVGRFNTAEEIDFAIESVEHAVRRLRSLAG